MNKHVRKSRVVGLGPASFAALLAVLTAAPVRADWYDASWSYREKVTIQGSQVSGGPHAGFPVLVSLASGEPAADNLAAFAQNDGDDILFTSDDETTKIPHEIEYFSGSTGQLIAWVKVDLNASPSNTVIYMYYGNGSCGSQQDKTNVWDADYRAVYHLYSDYNDSTSNSFTSTAYNSPPFVTGPVGKGVSFNGSSQYIKSSDTQYLNAFTISCWVKGDHASGGSPDRPFISRNRNYYMSWDHAWPVMRGGIFLECQPGGTADWWFASSWTQNGTTTLSSGTWYYLVGTLSGTKLKAYKFEGGSLQETDFMPCSTGSDVSDLPSAPMNLAGNVYFGKHATSGNYFAGDVDEIRISTTARSQEWIETSYANQYSPSSFLGIGQFTDITTSAGLSGISANSGYGASFADYDSDGYPDLVITGTAGRVYHNDGDNTFSPVGSVFPQIARAAHWGDFDMDGDLDFVITRKNPSAGDPAHIYFYIHDGGSFTEVHANTLDALNSNNDGDVAFFDYDGDGDLDLLGPEGRWEVVYLYDNDGDGTFTTIDGNTIGLDADDNYEATAIADYDNDGDLDIFLHGQNSGPYLWSNDGDGTFTDVSATAGLTANGTRDGAAWGDYDLDGDMDLYASSDGPNKLARNNGDGTFTDVTAVAGVAGAGSGHSGASWADYDNDGDLDLLVPEASAADRLYRNNGDGTFTDVAALVGLADTTDRIGAAWEDIDLDGDLDVIIIGASGATKIYRNNTDNLNYLRVRVICSGPPRFNTEARGARVEVFDSGGTTLLGNVSLGLNNGYGGDEPLYAHFGGLDPSQTYLVRVHRGSLSRDTLVVPATASTTIGATVIPQMVTIEEEAYKVTGWSEIAPE